MERNTLVRPRTIGVAPPSGEATPTFPSELYREHILPALSLYDQYRVRSVAHQWNALPQGARALAAFAAYDVPAVQAQLIVESALMKNYTAHSVAVRLTVTSDGALALSVDFDDRSRRNELLRVTPGSDGLTQVFVAIPTAVCTLLFALSCGTAGYEGDVPLVALQFVTLVMSTVQLRLLERYALLPQDWRFAAYARLETTPLPSQLAVAIPSTPKPGAPVRPVLVHSETRAKAPVELPAYARPTHANAGDEHLTAHMYLPPRTNATS